MLKDAQRSLPPVQRWLERAALFTNPNVQAPERMNVSDHPYIRHGLKIGLGTMPQELVFEGLPLEVQKRLSGLL